MPLTQRLLLLTLTAVCFATAQDDPPGRVGRLNYLSGTVSFQPGGLDEWVPAVLNRPLTTGDHLWVERESRAELHLGSSALRLSPRTLFQFLNLDDRTTQIRLSEGTLIVRLRNLEQDQIFEVDTPNLAFSLLRPGEYRIDANPDNETTTITVRGGEGEVTGGGQAFPVRSDDMARVTGNDSVTYDLLRAQSPDYFEEWAMSRDRLEDRSESARYVSRDMIGYEDLDANGDWRPEPEYGAIWIPRRVPADWAPYRYGHWAWIEPWGWTWVDDAPWGFAPFHYGRWAFVSGSWGWIPGPRTVRPVYAPALVAWVGGPRFNASVAVGGGRGGVAWFPLGPREVYVPAYRASPGYVRRVNVTNTNITNINVTNGYNNTNITNVRYLNRNAPNAVTAVSQETFVGARRVDRGMLPMQADAIQNAPVVRTAPLAPSRESVLGRSINPNAAANVARPPDAVFSRRVVANASPPPAPVPFMQRQHALSANPGEPLDAGTMSRIRSAQRNQTSPLVRQAPAVSNSATPANFGGRRAAPVDSGSVDNNAPRVDQPVYRGQPARRSTEPRSVDSQTGAGQGVYRPSQDSATPQIAPIRRPEVSQPPPERPNPARIERQIQRPEERQIQRREERQIQRQEQPRAQPSTDTGGARRAERPQPPPAEHKEAPKAEETKPEDRKVDRRRP
ncbi:MAG: hypothetical protein M3Z32_04040 [Acidobacteriota bacterium]|nr:hypothetical protein [Acidobacteriota bacterium]